MTMPVADGAYARSADRLGYIRFLPATHHSDRVHVEWFHFVIHAGELDVLVNFSLSAHGHAAPVGHVVLLARRRDGSPQPWGGDIHRVGAGDISVGTGRIRLEMGDASLSFDGAFRARARCRRAPLAVDLRIVPQSFACLAHHLSPGDGEGFHWVVTPRLVASGVVHWDGRDYPIDHAPAYHDHNWGAFARDDFVWDWTCSVATGERDPWNVVLVRILDRTRARVMVQGLLVWEAGLRQRGFRGDAISVVPEGFLRPEASLRVPRSLSLLVPGGATDVPARLHIEAATDGDRLSGVLECSDVARILVPRERDLGTTVIHEIGGRLQLTGEIAGRKVDIDAPAFSELVECQR